MKDQSSYLFLNRENAAQQLIAKLSSFKNKNCCIIAISNGAVVIANQVAERLYADMVFMPIERIKDPADSLKSIGVVSFDFTKLDSFCRDIPQEYISRQTRTLQSELVSRYPDACSPIHFKFQNRIVIIIDDMVKTSDEILGCLKSIRKQQPKEIIVAVPVIVRGAVQSVIDEADAAIFIHLASEDSINTSYLNFNTISDEEVVELLNPSIGEMIDDKPLINANSKVKKVDNSLVASVDRHASINDKKITNNKRKGTALRNNIINHLTNSYYN